MTQPTDQPAGLTTLGRIGTVYGVKGWVKLISFTDPAENILEYRHFILKPGPQAGGRAAGTPERIEIDESRGQGKGFIAHIRGCDDREQARQYTGRELQVEVTNLPDPGDNEFYWFQLTGLQVVNLQDENLGQVHHLMETGANDVLVVKPTPDSLDDRERLIPFIRDRVIKRVDLEAKQLRVDWEKDY